MTTLVFIVGPPVSGQQVEPTGLGEGGALPSGPLGLRPSTYRPSTHDMSRSRASVISAFMIRPLKSRAIAFKRWRSLGARSWRSRSNVTGTRVGKLVRWLGNLV